jgi:hypothetical protein
MEEGAAAYASEAAADFSVAVAQQKELKRLQDLQVCLLYVCLYIHTDICPLFLIDIRSKKSSSACKTCRDAYYISVHTCRYLVFFFCVLLFLCM